LGLKEAQRTSFKARLKAHIVKRAKELAGKKLGFSNKTAGKKDAKKKSKWYPRLPNDPENGLITESPAEAVREMFDHPEDFNLDCASPVFLVWWMAILDLLEEENKDAKCPKDEANKIFNIMFPNLVLWGWPSAGSELGNKEIKKRTQFDGTGTGEYGVGDVFIEPLGETPSQAGDAGYVGEHPDGENIMLLADGKPKKGTNVYGHGPEGPTHGVQPLEKFTDAYGALQKEGTRVNADKLEAAMKKATKRKGGETRWRVRPWY